MVWSWMKKNPLATGVNLLKAGAETTINAGAKVTKSVVDTAITTADQGVRIAETFASAPVKATVGLLQGGLPAAGSSLASSFVELGTEGKRIAESTLKTAQTVYNYSPLGLVGDVVGGTLKGGIPEAVDNLKERFDWKQPVATNFTGPTTPTPVTPSGPSTLVPMVGPLLPGRERPLVDTTTGAQYIQIAEPTGPGGYTRTTSEGTYTDPNAPATTVVSETGGVVVIGPGPDIPGGYYGGGGGAAPSPYVPQGPKGSTQSGGAVLPIVMAAGALALGIVIFALGGGKRNRSYYR